MIEPAVAIRRIALTVLAALVAARAPVPADAARKPDKTPVLDTEHKSPSGAITFRTPARWSVDVRGSDPETIDATGDGLRVRFLHRPGEHGYDSLHGSCMLERLAPAAEISPVIRYEYDFVGASFGDRRALDSAFVVRYDAPVDGHKEWRQRNVTIVGAGSSLCAISYAPAGLWKKSAATRAVLDGVLGSVIIR